MALFGNKWAMYAYYCGKYNEFETLKINDAEFMVSYDSYNNAIAVTFAGRNDESDWLQYLNNETNTFVLFCFVLLDFGFLFQQER